MPVAHLSNSNLNGGSVIAALKRYSGSISLQTSNAREHSLPHLREIKFHADERNRDFKSREYLILKSFGIYLYVFDRLEFGYGVG